MTWRRALVAGILLGTSLPVAAAQRVAVVVGVIVAALVFAWEHAKHMGVAIWEDKDGSKVYELSGPLFFGSVSHFKKLFDPVNDPEHVVVEFKNTRVCDHSGIEAIDMIAQKYLQQGKQLHLRHLSQECQLLLQTAKGLVETEIGVDPTYHIASDKLG